jgi:transcriptional regulator with XRE-family HTH domain
MDRVERKALREESARIFGENLARERERAGLSQVGLAKAAGLNRTHVGYLEGGKRSPVLNTIRLLAAALDIGAGVLVDEYEPGKKSGNAPG